MKRLLIGTLVLAAVVAPVMSLETSAGLPKIKKPAKIDAKTIVVSGGNPWPIGLSSAGHGIAGEFGRVIVSFPEPDPATAHVNRFDVTCTPYYKGVIPPTPPLQNAPTAPNTRSFTVNHSNDYLTGSSGYFRDAEGIHLAMLPYVDPANSTGLPQYPSLACKVDATSIPDVFHAGGGTSAGKVTKLPTSPSVDCTPLNTANSATDTNLADVPTIGTPVIAPGLSELTSASLSTQAAV